MSDKDTYIVYSCFSVYRFRIQLRHFRQKWYYYIPPSRDLLGKTADFLNMLQLTIYIGSYIKYG